VPPSLSDEEILERLLELNLERVRGKNGMPAQHSDPGSGGREAG